MSRILFAVAALALAAPGCSVLFPADDHVGGATFDGGPRDGGGDPEDAQIAMGDAQIDGGQDAGPPPPECATDAECGAVGRAACLAGRCVFCATPLASPVPVVSGTGLVRHFGMAVGNAPTASEIAIAWIEDTGATSGFAEPYFHRTSVTAPAAAGARSPITTPLESISGSDFDLVTSLQLAAPSFEADIRRFDIAVLGTSDTAAGTLRTYLLADTSGITSGTYPGADLVAPPAADLAPITIVGSVAVRRTRASDGTIALEVADTAYGNPQATPYANPDLPTGDYEPISAAGALVAIGGATAERIVVWDMSNTDGVSLTTPGRTSPPAITRLTTGDYLVAYGAGSAIHVRTMECTGTAATCTLLTETAVIETGATRVSLVQLDAPGDVPVLVSHDAGEGGGGRVALRVLRADRTPFDAPGGGTALALETFPAGSTRIVPDLRLGIGQPSAGLHYVVGWMRTAPAADAMVDLRLQSIAAACDP